MSSMDTWCAAVRMRLDGVARSAGTRRTHRPEPLGRAPAEEGDVKEESRSQYLGSIRLALKRGPVDEERQSALAERLANPRPNLIPARAASLQHPAQADPCVARPTGWQ